MVSLNPSSKSGIASQQSLHEQSAASVIGERGFAIADINAVTQDGASAQHLKRIESGSPRTRRTISCIRIRRLQKVGRSDYAYRP